MTIRAFWAFLLSASMLVLTGCGGAFGGDDDDDSDLETAIALAIQSAEEAGGEDCSGAGRQATWAEWAALDDGDENTNSYTFTVFPELYNNQDNYGYGDLLADFDGVAEMSGAKAAQVKAAGPSEPNWEMTITADGAISLSSDSGADTYQFAWNDSDNLTGFQAPVFCKAEHEVYYIIRKENAAEPGNGFSLSVQVPLKGEAKGDFLIELVSIFQGGGDMWLANYESDSVRLASRDPDLGVDLSNLVEYQGCYAATEVDGTNMITVDLDGNGNATVSGDIERTFNAADYMYYDHAWDASWKSSADGMVDWFFSLNDGGDTLYIELDGPDENYEAKEANVSGFRFVDELGAENARYEVTGVCDA